MTCYLAGKGSAAQVATRIPLAFGFVKQSERDSVVKGTGLCYDYTIVKPDMRRSDELGGQVDPDSCERDVMRSRRSKIRTNGRSGGKAPPRRETAQ